MLAASLAVASAVVSTLVGSASLAAASAVVSTHVSSASLAVGSTVVSTLVSAASPPRPAPVNRYLGDFSAVFGYVPRGLTGEAHEQARVRGHLLFVHDILAARDVSTWAPALRAARATNLTRLHAYALAGEFPHDDGHPDARRPTFVDNAGAICAVGALFAADRGRAAAERITARFKYAFIAEIADPALAAWQASSGLTTIELGMIQPAYTDPPSRWLPFGLLDRQQFTPSRLSATTETGTPDLGGADAIGVTLHGQVSPGCACNLSVYATLPMHFSVGDMPGVAAAGGPLPSASPPLVSLGTGDIGLYAGHDAHDHDTIFRLGALLPTAARDESRPRLASARAGDLALELPRSAGVRASASWLLGWENFPHRWLARSWMLRGDVGLDIATELDDPASTDPTHVIPRAGLGVMLARRYATLSIDTALAIDSSGTASTRTRWSTGLTARIGRVLGSPFIPALTVAAVRTPEGWGGTLALDIAGGRAPRRLGPNDEFAAD